ncbi:hypothetical protein AVEN_256438-1 [Araneus ventricosus]|uniref:Uncharacterized protein n=1 Tax=Araneus ventricosus TaxID=182803 RepID=A0A4Y2Q2V6_ARAVE|nr:hypothetical protein AVEN_256438-1 [Araneus ventricosus]
MPPYRAEHVSRLAGSIAPPVLTSEFLFEYLLLISSPPEGAIERLLKIASMVSDQCGRLLNEWLEGAVITEHSSAAGAWSYLRGNEPKSQLEDGGIDGNMVIDGRKNCDKVSASKEIRGRDQYSAVFEELSKKIAAEYESDVLYLDGEMTECSDLKLILRQTWRTIQFT